LRLERGEAGNRRIADWLASAGSTGAIVASAGQRLLPLPGVPRPGLAVLLPTHPKPTVLIDAGATADPKPEMLVQFGQLGVAYAQIALSFAGNVEGGDLMAGAVDVIVTDGFTGNVALKTLEGSMRFAAAGLRSSLTGTRDGRLGTTGVRRGAHFPAP
jgi:phosphate acyltransferase